LRRDQQDIEILQRCKYLAVIKIKKCNKILTDQFKIIVFIAQNQPLQWLSGIK
jgi:hypothetical protein